jgi:glycosyltransferase 2 family protein
LASGLIYWLIITGRLDFSLYNGIFNKDKWGLIGLMFVSQSIAFLVFIARWQVLINALAIPIPFSITIKTGLQGTFTNIVLPGSIGIDAIRILYLKRHLPQHLFNGASSILMDRLTGFLGLLLLGLTASVVHMGFSGDERLNLLLFFNISVLSLFLLAASLILLLALKDTLLIRERFKFVDKSLITVQLFWGQKKALLLSILLAIISHCCVSATWYFGMLIFSVDPPTIALIAVTSMLTIVRTIPITPMGLGVTDGLAESFYRLIGISIGSELQMLLRMITITISFVCGLAFLHKQMKNYSEQ